MSDPTTEREEVARAICGVNIGDPDICLVDGGEPEWAFYLDDADAALAASAKWRSIQSDDTPDLSTPEYQATPCLSPMIAADLRSAYEKGVEDSAGVGYMAVKDPNDAANIRAAIRALKGEGR